MDVLTCTFVLAITSLVYFGSGAYMYSKISRMLQEMKKLKMRESLYYRTHKGRGKDER